ncbi:hypothetical protein HPB51_024246 [Rhipicephalus microplus]|uniref:Major facilitator superfamily (MFS) profile domain-containing protein n=1 Tax=Rhipicephalus microplus TaxID=6941 RepID=A0A9J6DWV8_RHIMP|nr:hypothetical protein HPB51_024246 [Rhipicephalus microplus]
MTKDGPFVWDPVTQGVILGAFYYGYIITPIPGGRLAERCGAKWLFGLGTLFTGLLSLLIPVAAHAGVSYLIAVRVLQGIGEGVTYPAIEAQVAHWIPVNQRATAVSLIHTGGFFGVAMGMYISGLLAGSSFLGGWPSVFYVFAHLVPSIMLMIVPAVGGCNGPLSLVLFVLAGTVRGVSEAGYMAIPVDMAPDYAVMS